MPYTKADHLRKLSTLPKKSGVYHAFTIVELLIVVVVIAILAAIIIVSYNGVTTTAKQSVVKAEASQVAHKVAYYASLNAEQYPAGLQSLGFSDTVDTKYEYTSSAESWCATVTRGAISYYVSNLQMTPREGLCSGHIGAVVQGPWTKLSVSEFAHTCGIMAGKAYCWGYNSNGQLGVSGGNRNIPAEIGGLLADKQVTDISASDSHTCAVADSKAYCWGGGASGQLGNGANPSSSSSPVAVTGVLASKTVTAISAGASHSCAIADARVYCWGGNTAGELGDGTTTATNVPVAVVASGVMSGDVDAISVKRSSCALSAGRAYCWGADDNGRLGNGGTSVNSSVPTAVDTTGALSGRTLTAIAMGAYHVVALGDNGVPYSWGMSPYGLGNGSSAAQQSPVSATMTGVLNGKVVTAVAAGGYTTCVVASGAPYCWGDGSAGHLGNNANASSTTPVAVDISGVMAGRPVQATSSGTYHACALATGQMYCWGRNNMRQLGDGGTADVWYPVKVTSS